MKGASHPTNDVSLNPSSNESIQDVIDRVAMGRRQFLQGRHQCCGARHRPAA